MQKLLAVAQKEIGYHEDGNNITKYGDALWGSGISGSDAAWCCAFCWWCFKKAGLSTAFYGGKATGRCKDVQAWAKANSLAVGKRDGKPGDIILFDWNGDGTANHIGLIEKRLTISYQCIEGNWNNAVRRTARTNFNAILMVIRPHWDAATVTPQPSEPTVQSYIVKKGDTLWAIARKYSVTVDAIAAANKIKNRDYIQVGQNLIIPQK
jgi:nucleoid-associated protein YgaU